jgi:hypothetical protein
MASRFEKPANFGDAPRPLPMAPESRPDDQPEKAPSGHRDSNNETMKRLSSSGDTPRRSEPDNRPDDSVQNLTRAFEEAKRSLARAKDLDEIGSIADKFLQLKASSRVFKDVELESMTAEIKLRAFRRIGDFSLSSEKSAHGPGRGNKSLPDTGTPFPSKRAKLKAAGISKSQAYRAQKAAQIPEERFLDYIEKKRRQGVCVTMSGVVNAVLLLEHVDAAKNSSHEIASTSESHRKQSKSDPSPKRQAKQTAGKLSDRERIESILTLYWGLDDLHKGYVELIFADGSEARRIAGLLMADKTAFSNVMDRLENDDFKRPDDDEDEV